MTITAGRPLGKDGKLADAPALELDADGPATRLLRESPYPLASSPAAELWSVITQYPERDGSSDPAMVVWASPNSMELPPHVHPYDSEYFRTLRGEVTLVVDDERHHLSPGEDITIDPGQPHYFRNNTDDYVAFYTETPSIRPIEVQFTFFGMDHDGVFSRDDSYSEPDLFQGLLMSEYLHERTRITSIPFSAQRFLWGTLGRFAKMTGREAVDTAYLSDEFWNETVEQPAF
ncbi:cupin 2 conserved barrel domain protein [Halorubrum sp. Ib24]|nr:cupin 2 conserved barrel domain protein [Halorubrum sp. Ib24]